MPDLTEVLSLLGDEELREIQRRAAQGREQTGSPAWEEVFACIEASAGLALSAQERHDCDV